MLDLNLINIDKYWKNTSSCGDLPEEWITKHIHEISAKHTQTTKFKFPLNILERCSSVEFGVGWEDLNTNNFVKCASNDKVWYDILCDVQLSEEFIENNIEHIKKIGGLDIISETQSLSEEFILKYNLNFGIICQFQKLSIEFIEQHLDDIDWDILSQNIYMSDYLIEKYRDKLNWGNISPFKSTFSETMIEKYSKPIILPNGTVCEYKFNWQFMFDYQQFSENMLEKCADGSICDDDELIWYEISRSQFNMSDRFIDKYIDKLDKEELFWHNNPSMSTIKTHGKDQIVTYRFNISEDILVKMIESKKCYVCEKRKCKKHNINFEHIPCNQLSNEFIDKYENKINFKCASDKKLSENIIRKYENRWDWETISEYQNMSLEFIKEFMKRMNPIYLSKNKNIWSLNIKFIEGSINDILQYLRKFIPVVNIISHIMVGLLTEV